MNKEIRWVVAIQEKNCSILHFKDSIFVTKLRVGVGECKYNESKEH